MNPELKWTAKNGHQTNINLFELKALREEIADVEAHKVKMHGYIFNEKLFDPAQPARHCGTAGCIAGHEEMRLARQENRPLSKSPDKTASEALNLTSHQASLLFIWASKWPEFQDRSDFAGLHAVTQEQVLTELDFILETGTITGRRDE